MSEDILENVSSIQVKLFLLILMSCVIRKHLSSSGYIYPHSNTVVAKERPKDIVVLCHIS